MGNVTQKNIGGIWKERTVGRGKEVVIGECGRRVKRLVGYM